MEIGEKIRLKVKEEVFFDTSPAGPTVGNTTATTSDGSQAMIETKRKTPYLIKVLDYYLNWFLYFKTIVCHIRER